MCNPKNQKKMDNASINTSKLATLSTLFCAINGIPFTEELVPILGGAVIANIAKWYAVRGKSFNPKEELIEDEALEAAFERLQEIANLASIAAQTGIGMEGLTF